MAGSGTRMGPKLWAQDSLLGTLFFGEVDIPSFGTELALAIHTRDELTELLKKFWQTEEAPQKRRRTKEQIMCEEVFASTHRRDPDGRYVVQIPLKPEIDELGRSKQIAVQRFLAVERRLGRDPELREKYVAAMKQFIEAGHIQEADQPPGDRCYYIPHHAVTKKFRIVFDASCKTDRGVSLNDVQMVGEQLQDKLFDLLLRFRVNKIGISADVKKMYLQVKIDPGQWDLQRILWRACPQDEIKEFWITRVTFGMASAPHCAVRAMVQCARDHKDEFPVAARVIERDFYIDDCVSGAESKEGAKQLCEDLEAVLAKAGFLLRKFASNDPTVLPQHDVPNGEILVVAEEETSVLGLRWLKGHDELGIALKEEEGIEVGRLTKSDVCSQLLENFDPLGVIGPVMIEPKKLLQDLHKMKIGWGQVIPADKQKRWQKWKESLRFLSETRIPRWLQMMKGRQFSLHGFADASLIAFGAVVYVRVETEDGFVCNLAAGKSKITPAKERKVPRLELRAAHLLAQLMESVEQSVGIPTAKYFWTDSTVVLDWLEKDTEDVNTYVHNRVQDILDISDAKDWRHVRSGDNPADILSRGCDVETLNSSRLWWEGPAWLREPEEEWPKWERPVTAPEMVAAAAEESKGYRVGERKRRREEQKVIASYCLGQMVGDDVEQLLGQAKSLRWLLRRSAGIKRVPHNAETSSAPRRYGEADITIEDEEAALTMWVKVEQEKFYAKELKALESNTQVDRDSGLLTLNPFVDIDGVLRVGGRLDKSLLPEDEKHPIILPDISQLSKLIIWDAHRQTFHGGYQLTAGLIRKHFWITNLRRAIRTMISRCIMCIRYSKRTQQQLMGQLPADRVRRSLPFSHVSVDYAGPYEVRPAKGRFTEKMYVAVFVCMSTKAVHLELVEGLTSQAFVAAFTRFTSLRGSATHVWSDNGTTFVGAEKELKAILNSWEGVDSELYKEMRELKVKWNFITASAPHQGGLWEAAVKSMKHHLRRVVGQQILYGEMFRTLLYQISAIINSRPLTAITDSVEDLEFLTPGHFLIGRPMVQLFGTRQDTSPKNLLKRWELTQFMSQSFWKQWHSEYLHTLQQRKKWKENRENLKVGDLVLVTEDNEAPSFWKTGRIKEVKPGEDGLVRNVELIVAGKKRSISRPVQKLILLPREAEVDDMELERKESLTVGARWIVR